MENENKDIINETTEEKLEETTEEILEETTEETSTTNKNDEAKQETSESPVDLQEEKIKKLEEMLKNSEDSHKRTLAEFDNYRKRTTKEKMSAFDDGVKDTIEKILPIIDNIERALKSHKGSLDDPLYKGIEMTYKNLLEILASMDVFPIEAVGQKFDLNLHSAVAHEENDEYGENEIIYEMQKGYTYKDKVIRYSMVKVAN